jgi:hypothetical protein
MSIKKWIARNIGALSLAFVNVQNDLLGQKTSNVDNNISVEKKQTANSLAEGLIKGEINMEVRNLRWRMYKILQASQGNISKIVGYEKDENGNTVPITKTIKIDKKLGLKNIKLDSFDSYPLEMVIDNVPITLSVGEALEKNSHELTAVEYFANTKNERPISIIREQLPQFEIENYTKKLNVRIINNTDRLLEFCTSKYPDPDNRTSNLFIAEIKKILNGKRSGLTEIDAVEFVTFKSIGVDDFLEYSYKILKFDKIIEYNGMYVIKFEGRVVVNGENILEKYKEEELDKKYDNKEMRQLTI